MYVTQNKRGNKAEKIKQATNPSSAFEMISILEGGSGCGGMFVDLLCMERKEMSSNAATYFSYQIFTKGM